MLLLLSVCLLSALSVTSAAYDDYDGVADELQDFAEEIDKTNLNEEASYVRDLMLRRRGALDCHKLGDTCKGVIRCCGTNQCYWSDGFSLIKAGKCVECIQRNQMCQADTQCCLPLVCQKGKRIDVNGRCDDRRPNGSECHEGDQCQSDYCENTWSSSLAGYGGVCKPSKSG